MTPPPPTTPPATFSLSYIARTRGPLPAGEYAAEFVNPLPSKTITTRTGGEIKEATAVVKIVEGDYRGREIPLRFVESGPSWLDDTIFRDADALKAWRQAVGVEGMASDFDGVLKQIWKASRGKRVLIKIGVQPPRAGRTVGEMFLAGARRDDRYDF